MSENNECIGRDKGDKKLEKRNKLINKKKEMVQ
jgi:hypothetical protein